MSEMRFILERTGFRPVVFEGEELGRWETSPNNASPRYSGAPGRWTELYLYRTAKGRYVVHLVRHTAWDGEEDTAEVVVFDTPEEAVAWVEERATTARWADDVARLLEVYEELE